MLNPEDPRLLEEVARLLARPIDPVRLNLYEIDQVIRQVWDSDAADDGAESGYVLRLDVVSRSPRADASRLFDTVLAGAILRRASDIHIETYFSDVDVRYRVDGILHDIYTDLSPDNVAAVVNRIKVLAMLDIAERRRPQDGRIRCTVVDGKARRPVDLRVSFVPGPAGEDVVIRILDSGTGILDVDELGLSAATSAEFLRLLENPEGMLLVTAPTSAGKTTTLYSAVARIADGHRKILTAEDPIEYYIDRVNQKQVSEQMPWAMLLRALLRHNPDVLLFGEIRDLDTAATAIAAASTGHLVLGTLHTSDALGVMSRLRGLGVEDADLAAALLAVLGQRLVRRLCPACAVAVEPSDRERALFGRLLEGLAPKGPRGCDECHGVGYRGRVGIYELLTIDEEMQELLAAGARRQALHRQAFSRGFKTMTEDALAKVAAGTTSLGEVVRVIPYRQIAMVRDRSAV
jgi:type II secretory ATPase GspE/PulE/Tfp pilus assembly ATPase PilB-like protein